MEDTNESCPEDANYNNGVICPIKSRKGYLCTRDLDHRGRHHAHGKDGKCIIFWGWNR